MSNFFNPKTRFMSESFWLIVTRSSDSELRNIQSEFSEEFFFHWTPLSVHLSLYSFHPKSALQSLRDVLCKSKSLFLSFGWFKSDCGKQFISIDSNPRNSLLEFILLCAHSGGLFRLIHVAQSGRCQKRTLIRHLTLVMADAEPPNRLLISKTYHKPS